MGIRPYTRVSGGLFVGGDALIAPPRPQARNPPPPSAWEVARSAGGRDGRTESSAPTIVYRTCALLLPCHSEPVTDVTGVGIRNPRPLPLPLGEVAERSEDGEGKQRRAALSQSPIRMFLAGIRCNPTIGVAPFSLFQAVSLYSCWFALILAIRLLISSSVGMSINPIAVK